MTYELGLEGGEVVTPRARSRANIYVEGGRIAAVTPRREDARTRVDASGLLLMPGMVDAHVHFMDPGDPTREDFRTGTAAAARAGATTVIEHTHAAPVISAEDLARKRAHLRRRSHVDFALAAHAWPDRLEEVEQVWGAGAAFVKAFTCSTHGVAAFDVYRLRALFARVARCGAVCLVHAEDESLTAAAEAELRSAGRGDGGVIPLWRNREAEVIALHGTARAERTSGARVVAAHVSHLEALEAARGLVIESCPQYLTLREAEVLDHGPFRKFTPPARARSPADLEAMWTALSERRIDYISSDHAPSTRKQKVAGSIWDVHFGLPGIDTTLSVLLDGAYSGRIGYERVVEVYSEVPARTYGLWPAKGRLATGADADLVLVDPEERWTVRDADVVSRAGWSPFAGRTLVGRAHSTYVRGVLVAEGGGIVVEPGAGRFINPRSGTSPPRR